MPLIVSPPEKAGRNPEKKEKKMRTLCGGRVQKMKAASSSSFQQSGYVHGVLLPPSGQTNAPRGQINLSVLQIVHSVNICIYI